MKFWPVSAIDHNEFVDPHSHPVGYLSPAVICYTYPDMLVLAKAHKPDGAVLDAVVVKIVLFRSYSTNSSWSSVSGTASSV